ncbi:hypothetical protein [Serratia marcescens]|uniref:hypothetical protein n=1 Tax=Serratia marcescens TaxID=615 RepID=UPI00148BA45C|nr:hypothetical protein [Serratia marcescens]QJU42280.1 hypothetical protein HMI62_24480 [Serratia marcescens]
MSFIEKNYELTKTYQSFRAAAETSGNVNKSDLLKLLKSVYQCPSTTLSTPEREALKDNYAAIETLSQNLPASKNGGCRLLRDLIWQVSEQRQNLALSHKDKVTSKDISALQTSEKKLEKKYNKMSKMISKNHLGSSTKSLALLSNELTVLEGKISKIKEKFVSSEVSQKKPNMNKAKTIETLSSNIEDYKEELSLMERRLISKKNFYLGRIEQHGADQQAKFNNRYKPKVEKSFLGDGNS